MNIGGFNTRGLEGAIHHIDCQINTFRGGGCKIYWSTIIVCQTRVTRMVQSNAYCGSVNRHNMGVSQCVLRRSIYLRISVQYMLAIQYAAQSWTHYNLTDSMMEINTFNTLCRASVRACQFFTFMKAIQLYSNWNVIVPTTFQYLLRFLDGRELRWNIYVGIFEKKYCYANT